MAKILPRQLQVDLANPDSIKEKLPEIDQIVEEKRAIAAAAKADFDDWSALAAQLKGVAGLQINLDPDSPTIPGNALDAVVAVVEREQRPIMPVGVREALVDDGHAVEGNDAVLAILQAAVDAGRIQEVASGVFAANSMDAEKLASVPAVLTVPGAHLGLGGRAPRSKAEAAVRVLGSDPQRNWTTPEAGRKMVELGWMNDTENDFASLASTLSRLVAEGKIFRPERGAYRFLPPLEETSLDAG